MKKFSVVIPVKNEVDLIRRNLSSWCELKPSEIILCFDKPAPDDCVALARLIARFYNVHLRILEVERNSEYSFHQAWVRRKGFLEAKHDRILTGDIDLIVNKNVLKAVKMVGKNNVGLVSCSKFRVPTNLTSLWRCFGHNILRKIIAIALTQQFIPPGLRMTTFTGLYAISRPCWRQSEDEGIKTLVNPKQALRGDYTSSNPLGATSCPGEDSYLRDCMVKKFKVVYLHDIGAKDVQNALRNHPSVQFEVGRYNALERNRSLLGAIVHTICYFHPYYLQGFLNGRKEKKQ